VFSPSRFWELRDAVLTGDADEVALLARKGANLNQVDYNGRSALHMACAEGNYKVGEVMIQQGANINMKDRWGQTPLQVAVSFKHQIIIGKCNYGW
jgi:ankyrin repeat protein